MIRILSDSTCDLSPELIDKYGIIEFPLHVVLGDKEYLDGVNISPDDIYSWADKNKTTPKTSAPALSDLIILLKKYLEKGDELICFCISEHMSVTTDTLRLAAKELGAEDKISVISSMNLSTGSGLLVIEASVMAANGCTRSEIISRIESLRPLVRASFVVDTLTYLYRGGRCSGLAALAGSMLLLHPRIEVKDGKMNPAKKYRGRIDKVILAYAKDMEEDYKNAYTDRVFITHSGCPESTVKAVKEYLESLNIFKEILITRAGGVISSHCGPGTLGVLFISK